MSRLASQIISRILSVIGIVLAVHLGLVRQDENAAQTAELLSHLRNVVVADQDVLVLDRKSTRLNSSHGYISYAVFCLKKKKEGRGFGIPRLLRQEPAQNPPHPAYHRA